MEIQAQMPMTAALTGGGTAAGGGASASSGQASGGGDFSATLVGLLGAAPANEAAAQQAAVMPGLNGVIQLIGNTGSTQSQAPADEAALKQLIDALLALLGSDSEDAAALLDNPELQALLGELQALMMAQTASQTGTELTENGGTADAAAAIATANQSAAMQMVDEEGKPVALNPALFVPLEQEGAAERAASVEAEQPLKPAAGHEAQQLLQQLKQLLQSGQNAATSVTAEKAANEQAAPVEAEQPLKTAVTRHEAQQLLQQLKQLLQSEQGEATGVKEGKQPTVQAVQNELKTVPGQQTAVLQKPETNASSQPAAPAVTPVNPKLEYLAARSISFRIDTATSESPNSPLFEPLTEIAANNSDTPAIPLSEYLKQVPHGNNTVKAPIIMHAPTFVEDMTQLVMKSFSLNATADGVTEARLSLYPQHLGHVEIKLTMHNGQLIAQFMADSLTGKEMLESQLSQLRTTLQSQGIQVDKLEVSQNQAFQSGLFQEQRQQQFRQSGKQSKGNNDGNNQLTIEDETLEAKASNVPSSIGPSSIDVTA